MVGRYAKTELRSQLWGIVPVISVQVIVDRYGVESGRLDHLGNPPS